MIDLSEKQKQIIKQIINQYIPDIDVHVFGSRVTGKIKKYSDLDLVIKNDQDISALTLANLKYDFSESDLPFKVDVVEWSSLSDSFREIINQNSEKL